VLTLMTTPVVYLALDRFRSRRRRRAAPLPPFKEYPPDARALFPPSRARTAGLCAVRLLDGARLSRADHGGDSVAVQGGTRLAAASPSDAVARGAWWDLFRDPCSTSWSGAWK
jgi:hypothetical protein